VSGILERGCIPGAAAATNFQVSAGSVGHIDIIHSVPVGPTTPRMANGEVVFDGYASAESPKPHYFRKPKKDVVISNNC